MEKFCESLREYAVKIVNFEKKKLMPLTKEEYESYPNLVNYNIWKKTSNMNTLMIKIIVKLKSIFIIQVNIEVMHTTYII